MFGANVGDRISEWVKLATVAVAAFALSGCADKATPEYVKCLEYEASNDVASAWKACNAAIGLDPNSDSGKGAAAKLAQLKPEYEEWLEAQAQKTEVATAQKKQREEAEASVRAARRAQALRDARRRVERSFYGRERDGECIDKGLPDYRWAYEGGSRDEVDLVASEGGCKHLFPGASDFLVFKVFCCPEAP